MTLSEHCHVAASCLDHLGTDRLSKHCHNNEKFGLVSKDIGSKKCLMREIIYLMHDHLYEF